MLRASLGTALSHWSTLFEEYQTSALDFYARVEKQVARRELPDVKTSRKKHRETGVFSAKREYLRVECGKDVFDICAAPFGRAFFFSSWLAPKRPGLFTAFAFVLVFLLLLLVYWIGIAAALYALKVTGFGYAALAIALILIGSPFILGLLAELWGPPIVASLPVIGPPYAWLFSPPTYYKLDTALMFQKSVHTAFMDAIDELSTTTGLRALSTEEKKPILRGLVER